MKKNKIFIRCTFDRPQDREPWFVIGSGETEDEAVAKAWKKCKRYIKLTEEERERDADTI